MDYDGTIQDGSNSSVNSVTKVMDDTEAQDINGINKQSSDANAREKVKSLASESAKMHRKFAKALREACSCKQGN